MNALIRALIVISVMLIFSVEAHGVTVRGSWDENKLHLGEFDFETILNPGDSHDLSLDTSGLGEGVHTLYMHVIDDDGVVGVPVSQTVYVEIPYEEDPMPR